MASNKQKKKQIANLSFCFVASIKNIIENEMVYTNDSTVCKCTNLNKSPSQIMLEKRISTQHKREFLFHNACKTVFYGVPDMANVYSVCHQMSIHCYNNGFVLFFFFRLSSARIWWDFHLASHHCINSQEAWAGCKSSKRKMYVCQNPWINREFESDSDSCICQSG